MNCMRCGKRISATGESLFCGPQCEAENRRIEPVELPFNGAGATMLASEQAGRVCYAAELEAEYVAVALQRLSEMGLTPRLAE
jgi:hypothetical protein